MRSNFNLLVIFLLATIGTLGISFLGLYLGWFLSRGFSSIMNALTTIFCGIIAFSIGSRILWATSRKLATHEKSVNK